MEMMTKQHLVQQNGFLDIEVDPSLDLITEITKLKKRKSSHSCTLLSGI